MKTNLGLAVLLIALTGASGHLNAQEKDNVKPKEAKSSHVDQELIAKNMLAYQRSIGGWPKHINNVKVDYTKKLSAGDEAAVKDDASRNDATIDNGATVKEVRFLAEQYKHSGNKAYLNAAEKGISYLLKAQYSNGGWPQFFPDTSGYRKHITYNDNAMINVLNLLNDVSAGTGTLSAVNKSLSAASKAAVEKGIECILNTQVKVGGKLTAWCAQHDKNTLLPAKARSYELISLSGSESVGILQFLLGQPNPSERMKAAITAGVNWLNAVQIKGIKYVVVPDATKARGYDRLLVKDPSSVIWARFYEVDTNEPFICGRDGVKIKDLMDLEYERRAGYAWYGTWAKSLLDKYPAWAALNITKSTPAK